MRLQPGARRRSAVRPRVPDRDDRVDDLRQPGVDPGLGSTRGRPGRDDQEIESSDARGSAAQIASVTNGITGCRRRR